MDIRYTYDDRPPLWQAVILAVQHILAAFNGIIAVPLVVGGALALGTEHAAYYVSAAIFCAGVATVIQTSGWFGVGSRQPCVMGTDFTFVGPSIAVGTKFGMAGLMTATLFGSLVEVFAGFFLSSIKKLFPRVVTSAVITLIGLTLIPVAVDWSAGGFGAPDYGSYLNLGIALFVVAVIVVLNSLPSAFVKTSAVFLGMVTGYVLCILLGKLSFAPICQASWFCLPKPFYFGFAFHPGALFPIVVVYIVTTIETIGDLTAIGEVSGKPVTDGELKAGVLADGVGSAIGAALGGGANTSFSQNVGIIPVTGVASRYVVKIAGVLLVVLGLCPKLGCLVSMMPPPVLGGAGLIMFGMVAVAGMSALRDVTMNARNMLVFTLSLVSGLGVVMRPDVLQHVPETVRLLLSSGITTGTLVAVVLNLSLPEGGNVGMER